MGEHSPSLGQEQDASGTGSQREDEEGWEEAWVGNGLRL